MRKDLLIKADLLAAALLMAWPAFAQEVVINAAAGVPTGNGPDAVPQVVEKDTTADSAVIKFTTRYDFQDFGITGSDKAGLVTDLAHSWDGLGGRLTLDWWQRVGLDGKSYGTTYASEHDFTATGDWQVQTRFCNMQIEGSAAYYLLAHLSAIKDDVVEIYLDTGCLVDLGWATVTPSIRPMEIIGIDTMPDDFLVRFHAPINIPLFGSVSLNADPAYTINANPGGSLPHSTFRPSVSLNWKVSDALSVFVEMRATRHEPAEFDFAAVVNL